jgi:hypothetical protein
VNKSDEFQGVTATGTGAGTAALETGCGLLLQLFESRDLM